MYKRFPNLRRFWPLPLALLSLPLQSPLLLELYVTFFILFCQYSSFHFCFFSLLFLVFFSLNLYLSLLYAGYFNSVWQINWIVNLTGLRASQGICKAHFWVCLGGTWRRDIGYYIWSLTHSSLGLSLLKQACSIIPFRHDVSTLEPADHGIKPQKPRVKLNLFCIKLWVLSISLKWKSWLNILHLEEDRPIPLLLFCY